MDTPRGIDPVFAARLPRKVPLSVPRTTINDQHSDKTVTPMAVATGPEPVLASTVGGTT